MKVAVVGAGNVGLSLAVLLAEYHQVVVMDRDVAKVQAILEGKSPINDPEIQARLQGAANAPSLNLTATSDLLQAIGGAGYALIAVPTDYDKATDRFNTKIVENLIESMRHINPDALIVIKSTVPVGFTDAMRRRFGTDRIVFCPEFLREGKALADNLYPSRIVVGDAGQHGMAIASLFKQAAQRNDVPVFLTSNCEAEAIKLFSNTYLAMRVAFFNELDSYAMSLGLNTQQIVLGVSADPRIGNFYNNPGFGYGGYCLPKDTRQMLSSYGNVPQNLIRAIVDSNTTRLDLIANDVLRRLRDIEPVGKEAVVGIYRLVSKPATTNYKHSPMLVLAAKLKAQGVRLIVYEPFYEPMIDGSLEGSMGVALKGIKTVADLGEFKRASDLIITNRFSGDLQSVQDKVYTRDLFGQD